MAKKSIESLEKDRMEIMSALEDSDTPQEAKDGLKEALANIDEQIKKASTSTAKATAPKKRVRKKGTPNPTYAKIQQIAKDLKAKNPNLKHTDAVRDAWAVLRSEKVTPAPKKEEAKAPESKPVERKKIDKLKVTAKAKETAKKAVVKKAKESPKKESEAVKKAKRLKAKVSRVGKTYSYKVKGEMKTFTRDKDKDGNRTAMHVGKRVSKDGNVYYEYRDNRADTNIGKPSYKRPNMFARGGGIPKSYTHFVVRKSDGKIINGYDYKGVDAGDIKYFTSEDFKDMGISNKEFSLLTKQSLMSKGIDPFNASNWTNQFAKGGKMSGITVNVYSYDLKNTLIMSKSFETETKAERFAEKVEDYNDDGYMFSLCGYNASGKKVVDIEDLSDYSKADIKKEKGFADCTTWTLKMKVLDLRNTMIFSFTGSFDSCYKKFETLDGEDLYADIDGSEYAKGGVLSKSDLEDFNEWMEDGNVIKNPDGTYSTQDANFKNRIESLEGLKKYYKREFVGSYAKGGMVDLFEDYENIPPKIVRILEKYEDAFDGGDYKGLSMALGEVEENGYTFEYNLWGEAYGLRPKNVPLNKLEGYEDEEYARGGSVSKGIEEPFYEDGILISKPFYVEEKSFFGISKSYNVTNKWVENVTASFLISKDLGITKKDALNKANAFYDFCKKAKTFKEYEDLSAEFIEEWNAKEEYAKGGSTESGVTVEVRSTNSSNTLLMEKSFDTIAKAKAFANKINNDLSDSPRIDILGYDAKGKMVVEFYDFGSLDESDIEAGMEFYKPVSWKLKMVAFNKKTFAYSTVFTFSGSYKECVKLFNLIDMEGVEAVIKGGSYANGGEMEDYDPITNARMIGRDSQDYETMLKEYAGEHYKSLTPMEREQIIEDMKRDFDRRNQFAKGGRTDVNKDVTSTLSRLQPYLDEYTMRKYGFKANPEEIFVEYSKRPDGSAQITAVTIDSPSRKQSKKIFVDDIFETFARGGKMTNSYPMKEEIIVS